MWALGRLVMVAAFGVLVVWVGAAADGLILKKVSLLTRLPLKYNCLTVSVNLTAWHQVIT